MCLIKIISQDGFNKNIEHWQCPNTFFSIANVGQQACFKGVRGRNRNKSGQKVSKNPKYVSISQGSNQFNTHVDGEGDTLSVQEKDLAGTV